jgi:hypothetical protein
MGRSLDGASGWINSPPLTLPELQGKVVAVDFCTFTCINWIRTLPYVRAWASRYADDGLVMLGIHTPEFTVEQDVEHVRRALEQMRVEYPVALDADYAIWTSFANRYWPALYLLDADGQLRHQWFGEGDYERSEQTIRGLLAEAGAQLGDDFVSVDPQGPEAEANWEELQSPETYLGSRRTERFASPGGIRPDQRQAYEMPERLGLNEWALSGTWTVRPEFAVAHEPEGTIAFGFHARDLHLVMGPVAGGAPLPFRVRLDGEPPGRAHGVDVDADGNGVAAEPRLFQLIRQPATIVDRRFEIEFLEPGVEVYVFTFG